MKLSLEKCLTGSLFFLLIMVSISGHTIQAQQDANYNHNQERILYFEHAVRYNPISIYQNQLALAYLEEGDTSKAWYYSRQAVRSPPPYEPSFVTFKRLFDYQRKSLQTGMSLDEVKAKLGCPDDALVSVGGNEQLIYGIAVLDFHDQRLIRLSCPETVPPPYLKGSLYED